MAEFRQRMQRVYEQTVLDMKKRWWWLLVSPIVSIGKWTVEGWVADVVRNFLSTHATSASLRPFARAVLSVLTIGPLTVLIGLFLLTILGFFIHAYFETRPPSGIVGNADLLVIRLNLPDMHIIDNGANYAINLGVFVRAWVAATDRVRTVRSFEIELVNTDGTRYAAPSEHDIGGYLRRYRVRRHEHGHDVEETRYEQMADLADRARTPIQPGTHVEGWLRFEVDEVRGGHEPRQDNTTVRLWAVDVRGRRYPLAANDLAIRALDHDAEYATLGR